MIPRLDLTVLGATALVMVLVWWAYRKWHGRGYRMIAASIGCIVSGGFGLYLSALDMRFGRVKCYGKYCDAVYYWRSTDPADFWLSFVLWAAGAVFLAGMGTYVLHRTVQSKYRERQDANAPREYRRMEGVPSAIGTVSVLGLLAWILATSEPTPPPLQGPMSREPLQLRLDSGPR